jgi:proline racemase/trans-L-3-hydroxyproline dehydratase
MLKLGMEAFDGLGDQIVTLDLHVGGEPIRLVIEGLPPIPGRTINEKRLYISENLDWARLLLTREPRGHRDMFAGVITEAVSEKGHFGVVFMDARRYPYMCGHGVMGAVTAFIEMGWLEPDGEEKAVMVDTPSGPVQTLARLGETENGRVAVESVAIELESAFVFQTNQLLSLPDRDPVPVDVVFAGGFFVMVASESIGLALRPENATELSRLGMRIIEAGNRQLAVQHPLRTYINTIDVVEFYDTREHGQSRGKNVVVLGEGHVDRSPCGTGTSAKLALLYRRGEVSIGQPFVNRGLTGTAFEGRIAREIEVGDYTGIVPRISGSAYLTGLHRFVRRADDPFPEGFLT